MKWFGDPEGALVEKSCEKVETPTGECCHCGKTFSESDSGLVIPFSGGPEDPKEIPYHKKCFMENLGLYGEPTC